MAPTWEYEWAQAHSGKLSLVCTGVLSKHRPPSPAPPLWAVPLGDLSLQAAVGPLNTVQEPRLRSVEQTVRCSVRACVHGVC